MRTVSVLGARPDERGFGGGMAKLSAAPPRGVIGTGILLLISLFLLVAGAVPWAPEAPEGASAAARETGAFVLDPALPAAG
jgi:hypothetical protein